MTNLILQAARRRQTSEIEASRRRQARDLKILKRAIAQASATQEPLATSEYLNLRIRTIEEAQRDINIRRSAHIQTNEIHTIQFGVAS
jgi:hypothetical protein